MALELPPGMSLCDIIGLETPLVAPPNGTTPNFHNPPSMEPVVISISAIFSAITIFITVARLYINKTGLKAADYATTFALAVHLTYVGVVLWKVEFYRHGWDIRACTVDTDLLIKTCITTVLVGLALFFSKVAIFLFYMQIFSVNKPVRIGSVVGIIIAFLSHVPTSFTMLYFSAPRLGETWEDQLTNADRVKGGVPIAVAVGAASVFLHIYILVLPLPGIVRLHLPSAKKAQLIGLFAVSVTGVVASAVSLYYRVKLLSYEDQTWDGGVVQTAMVVENSVAIILSSLPAFAQFLRIYAYDSPIIKSFLTRIKGRSHVMRSLPDLNPISQRAKTNWSLHTDLQHDIRDVQSPYYELTEGRVTNTVTVPERRVSAPNTGGILRTIVVTQTHQGRESEEALRAPSSQA